MIPAVLDHVEIETEPALIELNGIDRAHRDHDARALQIARICQRDPFLIACRHQNFEGEGRLGRPLPQHRAVEIVTGRESSVSALRSVARSRPEPSLTGRR